MEFSEIKKLIVDQPQSNEFQVHRDLFRDKDLFELEMRHIFEGSWVFLGLASQVPNPHDFLTTWIGRHPVLLMRDADGTLGAFLNTCRHRGALVCHHMQGNAKYHVCSYHGWAYDSGGRNVNIKDKKDGCYPSSFEDVDHGLKPVARFGEYRGFLFASLNAAVPSLEEHLGSTKTFLDLIVDQSPQGVELVPGSSTYTYKGNWKLQIENCVDVYHLTSTHPSFMQIVERRNSGESKHKLKALNFDAYRQPGVVRGSFTFKHGHAVAWGANPKPEVRPLFERADELLERVGAMRTKWMLSMRNLTLYPNMQVAENASLQLRLIRPLAVDRTEMKIYCLAPVGESAQAREYRLRQYEDFFNSTGLATPDDTTAYEDCQTGYSARSVQWQQGYERGATAVIQGADEFAQELGIEVETSISGPFNIQDETVFRASYREWLRLMENGLERDQAGQRIEFPLKRAVQ
ncbi:MAG: aromatic ring-hydroxylating dioxygenase subunit alpha [Burkholderiaceae bacterium]